MGDTPLSFACSVARRNRRQIPGRGPRYRGWPPGHDVIVRTGRTKPAPTRRPGVRALPEAHEYRCSCGHVGWSTHSGVLRCPVDPLPADDPRLRDRTPLREAIRAFSQLPEDPPCARS